MTTVKETLKKFYDSLIGEFIYLLGKSTELHYITEVTFCITIILI